MEQQQPMGIPEEIKEAIQMAGDFYGYAIPDEDLKRRRPVQDFKAGAEWLYRYLAPQMEAMREERDVYKETLQKIKDSKTPYPKHIKLWAKEALDQYPSPIKDK